MFKKGPDIDKKKLLLKASDVKRDSLTRLKHFKTLIENLDSNELPLLFKSHFSFIYHTFIDTFSTFDCNSKQRREDLDCILFMLEKILVYNPDLIKKRWQFYSITFVMQKLLHRNNTWRLRQEGVRLFVLWYQILCDHASVELQNMFASLVPGVVPQSDRPPTSPIQTPQSPTMSQARGIGGGGGGDSMASQHHSSLSSSSSLPQGTPVKLSSINPLVPMTANEQLPSDEISLYLDSLLQFMVTQATKPNWGSAEEAKRNQECSFSFLFNMFKRVYLQYLFPDFNNNNLTPSNPSSRRSYFSDHSVHQYVDEISDTCQYRGQNSDSPLVENIHNIPAISSPQPAHRPKRESLHLDLNKQSKNHLQQQQQAKPSGYQNSPVNCSEQDRLMTLSIFQSIVIRWLTRIMRQDIIPGQDELMKSSSGSVEQRDFSSKESSSIGHLAADELSQVSDSNSTAIFQNMETTAREMEIARKIIGTQTDNITVVHELFRRAFLNYYQPASMKRVVNVYKEWICTGTPATGGSSQARNARIGYTSFGDLLQVFVLNSYNAFVTEVHNPALLDEQVEMCKRIMNIYRYMVMKIYMNTTTWEQLLNAMLSITEHLFPMIPPEKKETTIGGRIAPAFFQTFIVSWIRANLYVHISDEMWDEFHRVMRNLISWRELIEEWSTTMGSLTRVLVKHVYGLSLSDLPLDKPHDRRRRPKTLKSFSTTDATKPANKPNVTSSTGVSGTKVATDQEGTTRQTRSGSIRSAGVSFRDGPSKGLYRSNSDGILLKDSPKIYYSSMRDRVMNHLREVIRKTRSEYVVFEANLDVTNDGRTNSSAVHTDVIDGTSLKDPSMLAYNDQAIESQPCDIKASPDVSGGSQKGSKRSTDHKANQDKCVLLGGSVRGWTPENSVIMWRRMLGLFGNINQIEDPDNHLVAMRCLAVVTCDFIKTRENLGISIDNQSSPGQPNLIPPYTYHAGWLLEATHLPNQFQESRLTAYKLLCLISIRRHDIELPQQFYAALYESLHRGLVSTDPLVHASIIKNSPHLLSLELPGCTMLVQGLFERSRSILFSGPKNVPTETIPRDQAIQIMSAILALHRPIRKLLALKPDSNSPMNLTAPGDIKGKIFETFLACNTQPLALDSRTRSRLLCSMSVHVYQELCDKYDSMDVEKLFDSILTDLQDTESSSSSGLFCINCDLLRLFADQAAILTQSRPVLVSSIIQTICQLILRLSTNESQKESIHCLLICLEDWCIAVGKSYLLRPVDQLSCQEDDDNLSTSLNECLITIVLRSLEYVINDEQFSDDSNIRETRGSTSSTTKNSDSISNSHLSGSDYQRDRGQTSEKPAESKELKAIKLACKVSHHKLITYLGHFPFRQVGAASLSCCVSESDYLCEAVKATAGDCDAFNGATNIALLVLDGTTILSLIATDPPSSASQGQRQQQQSARPVHLIVRNLCGKYAWDASRVDLASGEQNLSRDSIVVDPDTFQQEDGARPSMKYDSDVNEDRNSSSSLSSRASSNRDQISDLLNQLTALAASNGSVSSSSTSSYKKRNSAQSASNPRYKIAQAEETMLALLTNQRFQELNYYERVANGHLQQLDDQRVVLTFGALGQKPSIGRDDNPEQTSGHQLLAQEQCRQFVQHLGLLAWEKRCKVDLLAKSARLLRELKNLDAQPGRETHKIAVIYVANGQEDKNSILCNSVGSRPFEEFVSALGWEVNLASHLGFKGGLQSNKSTGETSPYYCNSTTEVMFHVSTRIPLNGPADDESLNRKLRHLGNDEIHIVWSEHSRDYRRGIIPTEFGDVIIAIYPMLTFHGYYRVQISSKQDVPLFGPLQDNCIVHQTSLAALVRATAVNASRAKRLKLPYYQTHFEERSRLIGTIVENHTEQLSFEDFAVKLYQTSVRPAPTAQAFV